MNQYRTRPKSHRDTPDDLRTSQRKKYRYRQMIAPMVDGRVPPPEQFFEVACGDISSGGFSFYLRCRPEFDYLVVALGPPHELIHLTAHVINVGEVCRDGEMLYRVGCRFTDRVYFD